MSKAKTPVSWWTEDREKCLERILAGWSKKQIAADLGVHPNTISNWCAHEEFMARVAEQNADKRNTITQRREHETSMFTDRVAKLATKALDTAERRPNDPHAIRTAREWLDEYKGFRAEERQDMGTNVQRHQHAVMGQVQHTHALSQSSFKGFLEGAIERDVIDVEAVESSDAHDIVTMITTQALLESTLLDDLAEEERDLNRDPVLTSSERRERR